MEDIINPEVFRKALDYIRMSMKSNFKMKDVNLEQRKRLYPKN